MTVLQWPNEILTTKCDPVKHGERCRDIVEALYENMDFPNGIGLAAPQIGITKRIIAVQVPLQKQSSIVRLAVINPEIVWDKGSLIWAQEGCLSFPNTTIVVPRKDRIKVRGFDLRWNPIEVPAKGLLARVLQHEIDHLDGRTLHYYETLWKQMID